MGEMLPLETKQSGGKLLLHTDLRVGGERLLRKFHATGKGIIIIIIIIIRDLP